MDTDPGARKFTKVWYLQINLITFKAAFQRGYVLWPYYQNKLYIFFIWEAVWWEGGLISWELGNSTVPHVHALYQYPVTFCRGPRWNTHRIRVADPHSFHPDPDPAFKDEYRSGSRAFMTKDWTKITDEKKLNFFWSKTTIYLFLGLHKELNFFLLLWVIFAILDPDPIDIRIRNPAQNCGAIPSLIIQF